MNTWSLCCQDSYRFETNFQIKDQGRVLQGRRRTLMSRLTRCKKSQIWSKKKKNPEGHRNLRKCFNLYDSQFT